MAGLRRICKQFGGIIISSQVQTVVYEWDKKSDKPVVRERKIRKP